jgi:NADPH:quinone reductase-like Zn-dependent oxidoreductase
MKAIVYRRYGPPDVLEYEEIEKPAPGKGEVLIKVHATSVNPLDWHLMRGLPYFVRMMIGLRRPKSGRLGVDAAGTVEAAGSDVTQFKPGDEVFGACDGAFAEYVCVPESKLVTKPPNVSFEDAACTPIAASTALQALRDTGRIRAGQRVLVNGAAGGVGTFAVQLAKWFGAEVTGVCSTVNVEMVRSIGAARVIDYTREDFTQGGPSYDLILDCIGNHSLAAFRRVLNPDGRYVAIGGPSDKWMIGALAGALKNVVISLFARQKLLMMLAKLKKEDLALIGELVETGKIKPVIDRRYSLSEVPEAVRYLEEGHARGKVVITL